MRRFILGLMLTGLVCITSYGQDDQKDLRVYGLEGDSADSVANILQTLLADEDVRLGMRNDPSSIVLLANQEGHDKAKELIEQLARLAGRKRTVFYLKHRKAAEAKEFLEQFFESRRGTKFVISVDEWSNALVVAGSSAQLEEVRELIENIDVHMPKSDAIDGATNCNIRLTWLVDARGMPEDGSLRDVPQSLKDVAIGLVESELMSNPRIMTTSQVLVQPTDSEGDSFETSSLPISYGAGAQLSLSGKIMEVGVGKFNLGLELITEIPVTVGSTVHQNRGAKEPVVQENIDLVDSGLRTSITLPVNHPVAFSVSDLGKYKSAFVIEILKSN